MKFNYNCVLMILLQLATSAFAGSEYKDVVTDMLRDNSLTGSSIAVLDFSYSDGRDSRDGVVVSERVIMELVKSKKVTVVERRELEKVLKELKLGQTGLIDVNSTKDIGRMVGAEAVILGSLTELPEGKLELNARVISVSSGTVIAATSNELKKDWLDQYKQRLVSESKNIENNPKDADAFYQRGVTNYDLDEYDKAITDFGISISLNPEHKGAYLNRGFAYIKKQDYKKAIADLTKALDLSPLSADAYLMRGMAYLFSGQYSASIEDLNRAIAINPSYESAYINRGLAYMSRKEYTGAINDFNTAINLNLKSKSADLSGYANRGWVYSSMGDFDRAIEDYTRVIKINPEYIEGYLNRARVYIRKDNYPKAIADASHAIKINPKYTSAYRVRGDAYGASGEPDKALKDFDKAIEIDPNEYENYSHRAQAHSLKGELGLAIIDLTNAIQRIRVPKDGPRIYPGYSKVIAHRGAIFHEMKDYSKAIEDFTFALSLNPKDVDTLVRRSWAYAERADFKNGDYDKAISDLNDAIEITPNNSEYYALRGIQQEACGGVYTRLGEPRKAEPYYRKALNDYEVAIKLNPSKHSSLRDAVARLNTKLIGN